MTNLCACEKPTRDNAYACEPCGDKLNRALAETPWLADEIETSITRRKAVTYDNAGGGASAEVPMPLNMAAAEAGIAYRNVLRRAVKHCVAKKISSRSHGPTLPKDTLHSMSRWLMGRVDGILYDSAAPAIIEAVTAGFAHGKNLVDRPVEKQFAGPCECGRDLYRKPGGPAVTCQGCRRTYNADELVAWMRSQVMGRLVTVKEGSTLLGRMGLPTAIRTVQNWAATGRVLSHSNDKRGSALYLFDDLIDRRAEKVS